MNVQVNVRMTQELLAKTKEEANRRGYGNVQDFIRETIREEVFDNGLTKKERELITRIIKATDARKDYGTEEELFKALRR